MSAVRRALPLWLVLFAAYAGTLAVDATPGHRLAPSEARRLLVVESLTSDGDVDLADDYARRAYRGFYSGTLRPLAPTTAGRQLEPVGLGFALVAAPGYLVAGATGARLLLAAIAALAFCLAAALGRALVPEPWATRAALVTGLSPPVLAGATAVSPELTGAAIVAGAALLALRVREQPRTAFAFWAALLVAALPWLAAKLIGPAAVVAAAATRWLRRRRRALTGFVALEVALTSAVLYLVVNDRLFGGLVPEGVARAGATGASGLTAHLSRWPRLASVWLDPHQGLLVWAPFVLLAAVALGLLWRSRRDRLAVAVADQVDVEVAAAFLALVVAAVVLVAVFAAPGLDGGGRGWWHARQLTPALPPLAALAAWGWRFAPRVGTALALATVVEGLVVVLRG